MKTACVYAGISTKAWERFTLAYPEFRAIKEACEAQTTFRTMNSFQESIPKRPDLAFKYMEKRGDFNFETKQVDDDKPLQPTVAVQINNTVNGNESAIQDFFDRRRTRRVPEQS